jgi:ectoine hydroxylase-related dioxygenase (phytanoyl-CoA dioxygenase family)
MLTAWIPFADVTAGDGAMAMVDGSYRWSDGVGIEWQHTAFSVIDDVLASRDARLVPIELKRGQVSFHHCKTLHGSGPNRGSAPRRSLVVHFQPATNHYVERGRHHPNDDLVRRTDAGHPDYSDPDICPVLYP